MPNMGLQFGLETGKYCKRQHHWLFEIPEVSADNTPGSNALPPEKSARPSISFKEMEVKHLIEDVFFPAKPEWKPITITLFDLKKNMHPVFEWIKELYNPELGQFNPPRQGKFIKECQLKLLDGPGNVIESWIYEDCFPQSINFMTLDMTQSGVIMCELTLRYARAYIVPTPASSPAPDTIILPTGDAFV